MESRRERVERWIETLGGRAYALAQTLSDSEDDARDLLQEAWMFVVDHEGELPGDAAAPAFVFTIVRKIGLARIKRESHRSALLERFAGDVPGPQPQPEPDPDQEVVVRRLLQSIDELPTLQRGVVIARILEGRSIADTARKLGRAPGTVKVSLSRAVASLRAVLGKDVQEAVARLHRSVGGPAAGEAGPLEWPGSPAYGGAQRDADENTEMEAPQ